MIDIVATFITFFAIVVSRVMGLILSAVATANLLAGLKSYFALG